MKFELVKIRKSTKGWLVHINIIPEFCGCMFRRRIFEFEQEKEPTVEEIRKRYENKN